MTYKMPRVISTCQDCGIEMETTIIHKNDCLCIACAKKRHNESNKRRRLLQRNGEYIPSKRGRKAKDGNGSGWVRKVTCSNCGRTLLQCACLDELEMLQRGAALKRIGLKL